MKEEERRLIRLARRFDGCRYRCKEALNRIIADDDVYRMTEDALLSHVFFE
jgi:hypothetical protein